MLRTLRHSVIVPLCVLGLSPHADDSDDPRLEAILGAANSIGIVCDYTYASPASLAAMAFRIGAAVTCRSRSSASTRLSMSERSSSGSR